MWLSKRSSFFNQNFISMETQNVILCSVDDGVMRIMEKKFFVYHISTNNIISSLKKLEKISNSARRLQSSKFTILIITIYLYKSMLFKNIYNLYF